MIEAQYCLGLLQPVNYGEALRPAEGGGFTWQYDHVGIAATRLMARVRREFAVQLPLRLFLEFPTVRGLAAPRTEAHPVFDLAAQVAPDASTCSRDDISPSLAVGKRM